MTTLVQCATNAVKKFVPVRCLSCGKVFTHAAPGSTIRFRCRGCKTQQIVEV